MRLNRRTVSSTCVALVLMTASARAEPDRHGKTIHQCTAELEAGKAALAAAGESASKFIHDCWWHTKAGQRTPIAGSNPTKPDDTAAKLRKAEAAAAKAEAEAAAAKKEAARAKQDAAEARKAVEVQSVKTSAAAAVAPGVAKSPNVAATKKEVTRAKQDAAEAHKAVDAQSEKTSTAAAPPEVAKPLPKVASAREFREPARAHAVRVAAPAVRPHRYVVRRPFVPWVYAPPPRAAARPRREPARLAEVRVAPIARRPRAEAPPPVVEMVPVHIVGVPRTVRWPVFPAFVPTFRNAVNHPIVPGFTSTP